MPEGGQLEKMLIQAFRSEGDVENGEPVDSIEALINPETYTLEYRVNVNDTQGQGTSGGEARFTRVLPEELTFEFLFDNSGIIDGQPNADGVFNDVNRFRAMLTKFDGESHEPYHLKLVWGSLLFKGRATELGITHKLFNPDGQPIRSVARVKFKGSIEERLRAARENRSSPDLTHKRRVKAGETLPFMCYRIYGDAKYYLQVAETNGLDNFRNLMPGTDVVFPPLAKVQEKL